MVFVFNQLGQEEAGTYTVVIIFNCPVTALQHPYILVWFLSQYKIGGSTLVTGQHFSSPDRAPNNHNSSCLIECAVNMEIK